MHLFVSVRPRTSQQDLIVIPSELGGDSAEADQPQAEAGAIRNPENSVGRVWRTPFWMPVFTGMY